MNVASQSTPSAALIWHTHLRAMYNGLRDDRRVRSAWGVSVVLGLAGGLWGSTSLQASLGQWQAASREVVASQVVWLALVLWVVMFGLALFSTLQQSFGHDEARLLLTLPLAPAVRFRALFGVVLIDGLGVWLGVSAGVLGAVLGWQAWPWLALLLVGAGLASWAALVGAWFLVAAVLPRGWRIGCALVLLVAGGLVVGGIGAGAGLVSSLRLWLTGAASAINAWAMGLSPATVSLGLAGWLAVGLGPLAGASGRLYLAAALTLEGRGGAALRFNLPGGQALKHHLWRHRSLAVALLVKGLLNQSRHPLAWARLGVALVLVILFPQIYQALTGRLVSGYMVVVGSASLLALLGVLEYAPYALSGEGSRLALYLTAPIGPSRLLRAKLVAFAGPAVVVGVLLSLAGGWWVGLALPTMLLAAATVALIVLGSAGVFVLGSAWDADLNLTVGGGMQALLHEEMPLTPRRLLVVNLGLSVAMAGLMIVWQLPPVLGLGGLGLFNGGLLVVAWRFGLRQLQGLVNVP
jgi:hypothetical protein